MNFQKLEYEIIALSACKGRLTAEAKDLDCKLKECNIGNQVLTDKLMQVTAEKNNVLGQITRLQDKITDLECKLRALVGGDCSGQTKDIEAKIVVLKEKISVLGGSNADLEKQLADCLNDNDTCTKDIKITTTLLEQCKVQLQAITDANGNCEAAIKVVKDQTSEVEILLLQCNGWLDQNITELNACKDKQEAANVNLKNCTDELQACRDNGKKLDDSIQQCNIDKQKHEDLYKACSASLDTCNEEKKQCTDKVIITKQLCSHTSTHF